MPGKTRGNMSHRKENPKAVEARARKEAVSTAKKAAKSKAEEDAKWTDEGSTASEKRRAAAEAKKAEDAAKRAKKAAALAKDDADNASKPKAPQKLTHVRILSLQEKAAAEAEKEKQEDAMRQKRIVRQIEPEENYNQRAAAESAADVAQFKGGVVSASGLDDALSKLTPQNIGVSTEFAVDSKDKHPEKRMKAAFAEYEERQMPLVKADHPTLKLSQLREIIWKNWQKAPENPMVASAAGAAN